MSRRRESLSHILREFRNSCIELRKTLEALGITRQDIDNIYKNYSRKHNEGYSGSEKRSGQSYDPYSVLGVSRSDPMEKIEKVYKRLVKIYHPDSETGSEEMFKRINDAFMRIKKERGHKNG